MIFGGPFQIKMFNDSELELDLPCAPCVCLSP